MAHDLEIRGLHVEVEGKEILKGIDLVIDKGQVHAVMGPNGSGKSTLANTLLGHPHYVVTQGDILYKGESVLELKPDERARGHVSRVPISARRFGRHRRQLFTHRVERET